MKIGQQMSVRIHTHTYTQIGNVQIIYIEKDREKNDGVSFIHSKHLKKTPLKMDKM